MKVLLVRPKPHKETIGLQHVMVCEPLELEYLVSNVPSGIRGQVDLKIIDMILERVSFRDILKSEVPDFVVFTGYITHIGVIKDLSRMTKTLFPQALTGVGGVHAEVVPYDFESPYIDFIYSRNGIDGFNETLKGMAEKKSVVEINGILDNLGEKHLSFLYNYPARDAVSKYRDQYYYMFHNPCALIKTSYGCPYHCSFCFCKEITDGKYFARAIRDVVDELETIKEEEIYIVDDDFLFNTKRLREFMRLLRERRINKRYLVYGRADFVAKNEELLREFRAIGLQAVIVGIESIRGSDLDAYHKGTDKDINEEAIRILKRLDIELYATLIIPIDFSKGDFSELTRWLKNLNVRFVNLQPLTPLPGTEIFDSYTRDLLYPREKHELWDMAHVVLQPRHMTIRAFYLQILLAYYRIIMRPKHIFSLIRKYGYRENIKMLFGSSAVSAQYLKKVIRGY